MRPMEQVMTRRLITVCIVAIAAILLVSCSESIAPVEHDDPSRYSVEEDILWASPEGFDLTMDIYTPKTGQQSYPVLVIFHGGGWLINDKSIMVQMSRYIASNGEYVVCNVDYRLLADEGNTVTLNQIVDDVFGAVLWVKDNIHNFHGDPSRIAVTGDSAGAHLSAMIVNQGHKLSSVPFQKSFAFNPTYLPSGKTPETVAEEEGLVVQAALLSYGAYDVYQSGLNGFEGYLNPFWLIGGALPRGIVGDDYNAVEHPTPYKAVSPIYHIPPAGSRTLPPHLVTVGSEDGLTTPESVRDYMTKLEEAGHPVRYWEYPGKGHAYLDSGSNAVLGNSFENDAPAALDVMLEFLDEVFYP
jgi:acetyl esterase